MITITVSGRIKAGKTTLGAFIAQKLMDEGIDIQWDDRGDGPLEAGLAYYRRYKTNAGELHKLCPKVRIQTQQLSGKPVSRIGD